MTAIFRTSKGEASLDPDKPHVILVGLPGAGKSTVGLQVGEALRRTFLDFDEEIVRRERAPITTIFAEKGEHHFRRLERDLTEELSLVGNMILAPGGGWIANPECVAFLRPPAILIYLKVSPATAIKRLGAERGSRPLLNRPDPLGELKRLLTARQALYEGADLTIDTEVIAQQRVVDKVIELASGVRAG
jgi:shikimate kinase